MDNRETLTPSSGDAILKRHLFSEVARNWIKGRGHIERGYFVRRPSRQSFGFRVAASSGPIPKAPGSAGGYLQRSRGEASLVGGNGAPSGFQGRGRVRGVDTQHACSGRYATAVSCPRRRPYRGLTARSLRRPPGASVPGGF